ncbi:unnamed protein product [Plasmodium vivax]|uniref:(malaria parasite P. vivax) hypothetical protein n=1 Tax=Plasmodium vivax TaxID=5855 RepID=A0A8S4HBT7_PLAVI|nr:unnamed protein product [Plasmodium vivax]
MIYGELNSSGKYSTCNYLYDQIDENTFNTYKLLFDYSKDHGNIKLHTVYGNAMCDKEYINFVQNYINTYEEVYSYCTVNTGGRYDCDYFNKLFKGYNHKDLTSFHCMQHNVQVFSDDQQGEHEPSRPSTSVPQTSRRTPVPLKNIHPQGNKGQNLNRRLHEDRGLEGRQVLSSQVSIPMDETAESGSTKTIMGSVVPVTPVGGFINKLIGRNINMYNAIEGMDEFNPYSDGMNPGDRRMNISYHRL